MLDKTLNSSRYTGTQLDYLAACYAGSVLDNAADSTPADVQDALQQLGYSADLYAGTGSKTGLHAYCVLQDATNALQSACNVQADADVQRVLQLGVQHFAQVPAPAGVCSLLQHALCKLYLQYVCVAQTTPNADTNADLQALLADADL